ncbi:Tol-Pal system beta propeller repeat protein TolB [Spectribacter hydrogenoxidans]|uniref:Tol-Pal system protein TolB n=1 Tax=Spectribacter hydrogenoxidans TaxID=3075608 RepID=A0ABU3C2T5_9GAMM|nr:Tol-Pal system beta propeller repeat protein TolB [Salinisphaera sp. W335]MDT0635659.1 Tol-Pal system beta propeller repeat protein TolB [Salinisphaera sp. W335]
MTERLVAWSRMTVVPALMLLLTASPARAALEVEITQGVSGAQPIAIVPFARDASVSGDTDIASVVDADLERSGLFEPLARDAMLETPGSVREVDYANWRSVEVDNVVVGRVSPDGRGGYRVSFDIIDVYKGRSIGGYEISAREGGLRDAAHAVANRIYEQFTGNKGYFLSRIAYVAVAQENSGPTYRLVVADYDGHNPQTIARSREPILSPAWHPAGTKLAYVAFDMKRGRSSLRIQDLGTGEVKEVSSRPGINGAPAWSPNGNKLAMTLSYRGNPDIYTYDLGDEQVRQITRNGAIDTEPSWSPDGSHIVFTSDRGGKPQVYRVRSGGGNAERLTFDGESNQRPSYSPDGEKIVLVQGGNGFRIAVLDLETNNMRVVSDGPLDEGPSFAPNGQVIIYARQQGNSAELATVSADGRIRNRLRQPGDVREPAWSPAGY